MSDVWVARKRWTCKYCNVTINDDAPSRRQHENGLRHKGNVERAVREATKSKHRSEADQARARRELQKIERLAMQSHAADQISVSTQSSSASPGPSSTISSPPVLAGSSTTDSMKSAHVGKSAAPEPWRPKNTIEQRASPFAQQLKAEQEAQAAADKEAEEAKAKEGNVGEWETVEPAPPVTTQQAAPSGSATAHADSGEPRPRPVFQMREKQGHYSHDDEDDDGGLAAEIKVKRRMRVESEAELRRAMLPTWKPMRIDTGVSVKSEGAQAVPIQAIARGEGRLDTEGDDGDTNKIRSSTDTPAPASLKQEGEGTRPQAAGGETSNPSAGRGSSGMFKKRKAGAGAGAKKVRAVT